METGGAKSTSLPIRVQSNFGQPGNLELVVNAEGQLLGFFRDSGPRVSLVWSLRDYSAVLKLRVLRGGSK